MNKKKQESKMREFEKVLTAFILDYASKNGLSDLRFTGECGQGCVSVKVGDKR